MRLYIPSIVMNELNLWIDDDANREEAVIDDMSAEVMMKRTEAITVIIVVIVAPIQIGNQVSETTKMVILFIIKEIGCTIDVL